jgi:hypothetical protein
MRAFCRDDDGDARGASQRRSRAAACPLRVVNRGSAEAGQSSASRQERSFQRSILNDRNWPEGEWQFPGGKKRKQMFVSTARTTYFDPKSKCQEVCDLVAIGWKADLTRTSNFGGDCPFGTCVLRRAYVT